MMLNIHKSKDGPQQATKHTSTGTRVQFYSINLPLFYMYMASLGKKKIQYIFCTSALLLIERTMFYFPVTSLFVDTHPEVPMDGQWGPSEETGVCLLPRYPGHE